ncbi:hypothetical protein [Kordia sp.]|uniref:hypothetical protein n=1 Tax=Kordia sp. TaxID=1965332 RepID=UPI003B5A39A7
MKKILLPIAIMILPIFTIAQTFVPDDNFEQALIDLGYDSGPLDDYVPTANINVVTSLNINQKNIIDLTGIADFTALEEIYFSQNQIQTADFTNNSNLTLISAYTGDLTSINITGLTNLETVYLQLLDLSSLDVSTNTSLKTLHCNGNDITDLNVNNSNLTELDCSGNGMTILDLSNTPALKILRISGNQFQTIDLSHNSELTLLNLYGTPIETLDLSNNTLLEYLYVNFFASNQTALEELDLSNNPALKLLRAQSMINLRSLNVQNGNNTAITTFVVTNTPALSCIQVDDVAYSTTNWTAVDTSVTFNTNCDSSMTYVPDDNFEQVLIDLGYDSGTLDDYVPTANINSITSLDVSSKNIASLEGIEDFLALETLYCNDNQLATINITSNVQLRDFRANDNNITTIDVSLLDRLEVLSMNNNQLSAIDISLNNSLLAFSLTNNNISIINTANNPFLLQFICGNNQLTTIDTSGNPDLIELYCFGNQISTIDVSSNPMLQILWCRTNQITSINTTGLNALVTYVAYENQLSSVDVSTNTALDLLSVGFNNITTVDVSNNLVLKELYTQSNQLSTLNVNVNTALEKLWCFDNDLSVLDVTNNTNLQVLDIGGNDYTTLDVSLNTQLTEFYTNNCMNLEELNIKNGNNTNLTGFQATSNPNLTCIEVDDAAYSTTNWTSIDAQTSFSENCNYDLVYIPDDAFEQALIDLGYDAGSLDDYVLKANINTLTSLNISNKGIVDMTGIEEFVALETLDCSVNSIANLDISSNTLLTSLNVSSNVMNALALSTNLALISLDVSTNGITSLNLENHTQLTEFNGANNNFELLSVKNGNNTSITNFSTLNNPNLTCIEVDDAAYSTTNWTSIDGQTSFNVNCQQFFTYVPDDVFEQALIDLGYDSGPLNDYVLTANINTVLNLDVSDKGIADLTGIKDFTALQQLNCSYNILTSIDVSNNTNLLLLNCGFNLIPSIDVSNNTALQSLTVWSNEITTIDVSNNLSLTYLDVDENNLTVLKLDENPALNRLFCSSNNLETLNVQNGNNLNFTSFSATLNPNLSCIQVDDAAYSTANWSGIDAQTSFSESCNFGNTYVPDDAFEQALIDLGYDSGPLDDLVLTANIETVTILDISNKSISDLTGIEDFTALQELNCSSNMLGTLNVSSNLNLTSLNCASNVLTTLDIFTNVSLTELNVSENMLTTLNVNNNSLLVSLNINNNNIAILNANFQTALNELYANNNALEILNVKNGNNTNFVGFSAIGNSSLLCIQVDDATWSTANWTGIDVQTSFNQDCNYATYVPDDAFEQALIDLGYDSGALDDFVPTANINTITTLNIASRGITDLTGIENFAALQNLYCANNSLTNLNVSNNTALAILECEFNDLTSLNVKTPSLERLVCKSNKLTTLDLSNNPALFILECDFNELTTLDFTMNTALRDVNLSSNNLTTIDMSTNTLLEDLRFTNNQVTSLNISNSPILTVIAFSDNKLTTIDLSNNINLEFFLGQRNYFTSLEFSANPNLEFLACGGNKLTNIDVSSNTMLNDLNVHDNFLTELDVTTNINLEELTSYSNQIQHLDLSNNVNLTELEAFDNQLTSLNVQNGNNSNVTTFNTTSNPNLYCVLVDAAVYSTANWTNKDAQTNFNETSCDYIELSPKVFLQGASLNPNTGEETLMRDDLRVSGLISETSPYADGATISELVRTTDNLENSMVDWVWVELRNTNNPRNIVAAQSAILQRDGDIVSTSDDLMTPVTFNAIPADKYHVVIKHRNHLGIMTASRIALKQGATTIDFTNANNQITFGSNAQTTSGMQANKIAMWAGNVNGDQMVQYSGTNPDTPAILSTVLNDAGNFLNFPTYSVNGYKTDDLNMDGNTQYSGTTPDTPVILQNVLAHPGNFLNFSTYQINEQLPEND